jgi:hypothetical protein
MLISIYLIALLVGSARHDAEDQHWALRTDLPKSDIRAIRIAAGITGITQVVRNVDAASFMRRNQILLVESRGGCLRLHVIERNAGNFKEIWALNGLQDRGWTIEPVADPSGRGVCSQAPRGPSAHATSDGRIVVEVPTMTDPFQRSMPVISYSFAWDGSTYALSRGL